MIAAAALAGASTCAVAADTIKIALAGPVTGPVAQYGDMQFIGAKMAIEQINQAGGVNGAQLEGERTPSELLRGVPGTKFLLPY